MAEKKDIRKALDTLLGDEFTEEQLQGLQLFVPVASWDRSDQLQGFVTRRFPIFGFKSCQPQKLLDVSSAGATGTNGKARFRLTQFTCVDIGSFERPVNVVATPFATKPVILTIKHALILDPSATFPVDVEIEVFTWDINGALTPNISFEWRCRVAFEDPIV